MNTTAEFFGHFKEMTALHMSFRALLIFIIALVLIRVSGRRSFGIRMPFDNVISILLGAILSGAVTGISPFFSTIAAAATVALLHRLFAWICLYSSTFGRIVKGDSEILFTEGKLLKNKMKRYLISEKDLMAGLRINANTDSLDNIKEIYMERNGQISVVKKDN